MDSIEVRLIGCFQLVFPDLPEADIPHAAATSVSAWDSVATVTLISLVEEAFGVQIDLDDVEHLLSFEDFLKHVHALTPKPANG